MSRYSLSVQAFDSGSPAMSSTVTLNIDISDMNDNPPVFSPPNSTAIIQVPAFARSRVFVYVLLLSLASRCPSPPPHLQLNQAAGSTLLKLSVSDADSPRNGPPFNFRIVSGNEENFFSLDQAGTLRSNRVFDPEAPREFTLEIQVCCFLISFTREIIQCIKSICFYMWKNMTPLSTD